MGATSSKCTQAMKSFITRPKYWRNKWAWIYVPLSGWRKFSIVTMRSITSTNPESRLRSRTNYNLRLPSPFSILTGIILLRRPCKNTEPAPQHASLAPVGTQPQHAAMPQKYFRDGSRRRPLRKRPADIPLQPAIEALSCPGTAARCGSRKGHLYLPGSGRPLPALCGMCCVSPSGSCAPPVIDGTQHGSSCCQSARITATLAFPPQ